MKITISKAAQLYFVLSEIGNKELSFTTAYRIKRNLDHLTSIGEKYVAEVQAEGSTVMAEQTVFKKWEDSGEEEDLDLKTLELEKEDIKLTARQVAVLEPLLSEDKL
jgi:NACalpha-BTF3-like transcription factor